MTVSISTKLFSWHSESAVFSAELSDLYDVLGNREFPQQFFLRSTKTDHEVLMQLTRMLIDQEGELTHVIYMPISSRRGEHNPFTLKIFND